MNRPFIAWPGWPFLRFACLLSAVNGAWFGFVYGGCEWLTAHRTLRVPIHLPIELSIPLVPGALVVYMSIYILFLAGPFIVRDRTEFLTLIGSLALATLVGGIGFLLIPSSAAFAPPGDLGGWAGLFHFADRLNLDYNMVPSLHVALAVCCIAAFARHASPRWRALLWIWAAAIALSTVLTHQHHLVDAVTGWGVGIGAYRMASTISFRRENANRSRVEKTEPKSLMID
jgi:membrane-associated phospholipid phosphatase